MFDAEMDVDGKALKPIVRPSTFVTADSHRREAKKNPNLSDIRFDDGTAQLFGCENMMGLSIPAYCRPVAARRGEFHRLAQSDTDSNRWPKPKQAMDIINSISDPELTEWHRRSPSALIDGEDTPRLLIRTGTILDDERLKARDMLFSGDVERAIESAQSTLERMDRIFAENPGVPRYFNSHCGTRHLQPHVRHRRRKNGAIPDNLFLHAWSLPTCSPKVKGVDAALPHLNASWCVTPPHTRCRTSKLAVQLGRAEDWDPARAACLNALNVALDREDASFAYYRLAYAEWMCDHFDLAAASYIMSEEIAPGRIAMLESELQELIGRAQSQCIPVPTNVQEAIHVLADAGLPVWPNTPVAPLMHQAARVCVDKACSCPHAPLSVAAMRMDYEDHDGADVVQVQFLRSLNN